MNNPLNLLKPMKKYFIFLIKFVLIFKELYDNNKAKDIKEEKIL